MRKSIKVLGMAAAASAALVVGSFTGVAIASAVSPTTEQMGVTLLNEFRVTDQGLTYGFVDQGLAEDPGARADLVAVTTDDGKDGWAYSAEYMPWNFVEKPDEAAKSSTNQPYTVPVYELDGKSLIGYQTVNRPAEK